MMRKMFTLTKSLCQKHAVFLFFLIALMALPSEIVKVTAQPLLPQKPKAAVQDFRERAKGDSALPNDSTKEKKKGPRRVHTVEWYYGEKDAYSLYLDGQEYYQKIIYDASAPWYLNYGSSGPFSEGSWFIDGYEPILEAESVTIPEQTYSGMYETSTVLKPISYDSYINDRQDISCMPTGSYENFETLQEYLDWKRETEGNNIDEAYWTARYNWSQSFYEEIASQPNYKACLGAESINTLSYEDEFGVLDNSRPYLYGDHSEYDYRTNGCVPDFAICMRDNDFQSDETFVNKNLGIKQLIVPSKVKMVRWMEENSENDNEITYTPYLETITFQSTANMRQIGGFKNYKHLQNCALGTLTGLKVIEDEAFSGCTSLNIDSVDLRGMWVGREAFKGVKATHLDIDAVTSQKGNTAKLYGVECPVIKMYHNENDTEPFPASRFLKYFSSEDIYVLDSAEVSTVYVPCRLYADYVTAPGWRDIKKQIVPYNETEEDQCKYYVIIDGVRIFKDVAYSKDDDNHALILRSVGKETGSVLEIPRDFEDIHLDEGYTVQEIGPSVCKERTDFNRVILPTTIKVIDSQAFQECGVEYVSKKGESSESNSFPDDIITIEDKAFYKAALKGGLWFPNGLRRIGNHAFAETSITSLYLPGTLSTADENLGHWYVNGQAEAVYFQGSKFAIDESAFFGCPYLTSVYMAEGINGVAECAFQFCPELVSMHIPNSMRYIGGHFCCAAWKMTSLTIPAGVTDIDGSFLHGCESMRNVYLLGPPSMLKAEHYRSGNSFGPVDPIMDNPKPFTAVPNYMCKHVNNCTFHVNDKDTYYDFINYENLWGENPWLRLDRFDLWYNLYGSNNPYFMNDYWYSHHINDFPVVDEYYEAAASSLNGTGNAPSRRSPEVAEGRTNDASAYLKTGYHNTYNYFPTSYTIPIYDGKWSTICFPKYIPENLDDLLGDGAIVAVLTSAILDREDPMTDIPNQKYMYHLTFTPISVSQMEIDQPYLIRPGKRTTVYIPIYDDQHPMEASDWTKTVIKTVQATDEVDGKTTDISMVGTYIDYNLRKAEFYLKNYKEDVEDANEPWSMKFYKNPANGSSSVGPFKCYFKIEKNGIQISNAAMGTFVLDEDADGIGETLIADSDDEGPESVFTLNGMRVTNTKNLKPGIYIMNGKKVVVK